MLVLVLQNVLTHYYHIRFQSKAIRQVEARLRDSLITKLQELAIPFQKDMQSGRIQSKIMRDVEAVHTLSDQVFIGSMTIGTNLIVALAVTFFRSPVVFLFFMLTVPIAALLILAFRKPIKHSNASFRQEMETTSAKVIEAIELAPLARAHALEQNEVKRLRTHFWQIYFKGFNLDIIQAIFGASSWVSFQLFQVLCLAFTGILALRGSIQPGDVVLYQTYFTTIVGSVSGMVTLIPTIAKGMESVNSIGEIMTAGEVEDYQDKQKVQRVEGAFCFENVHYRYPKSQTDIIHDLTLEVHPGETIALVGPSGSGKSTILNLIIGFIKPTKGKVYLEGVDMAELDLRSFRKHLAVVPQNTILFDGSIRDNITYGLESVSQEQLEEVLHAANLWKVIQNLPEGLDTMIGEHGDKLSGGQRQRLSIARALIRNPKVILLDEATSALDSVSERRIKEALANLSRGRTTFIVAHRLSTIRDADKIAVIEQGRCVEFGTFEELMAQKGTFYEMQALQ